MKNLNTVVVVLLSATVMFSQKAKVQEGNIKNLKGISQYDLVFDYSDVQIPKYDSEEDFLKDEMDKRDEKEPRTGEKFKIDWFDDREEQYEPKFIESFNKSFDDGQVKVGMNLGSEYVMKVHTTFLYSGYYAGIVAHNAKLDAIISVYKKDNPSELLYSVKYTKAEGRKRRVPYDQRDRISESYAKLAKTWAKVILKKAK